MFLAVGKEEGLPWHASWTEEVTRPPEHRAGSPRHSAPEADAEVGREKQRRSHG